MSYFVKTRKHDESVHPSVPPAEYYEAEEMIAGGYVPETGCTLTLKVRDQIDLEREVFRSEMATVKIPQIALEQPAGTSRYATLGDMLLELRDGVTTALRMMNTHQNTVLQVSRAIHSFASADSPFTFVIDDPLGISFICGRSDASAPQEEVDDDPSLTIYRYKPSWIQDSELGIVARTKADQKKTVDGLVDLLRNAKEVVLFSGAGISTESGIPAFRNSDVTLGVIANDDGISTRWRNLPSKLNPAANSVMYYDVVSAADRRIKVPIWKQFDPEEMQINNILSNPEIRSTNWDRHIMLRQMALQAKPNPSHQIANWLLKRKKLKGVITQNIDGLYQKAGVPSELIVELHGSLIDPPVCIQAPDAVPPSFGSGCGKQTGWDEVVEAHNNGRDPCCVHCGGLLFAHVIAFGQPLDPKVTESALDLAYDCDLMVVMGTGLAVAPANRIAGTPLDNSTPLVIVNKGSTPLDNYASVLIDARCGEVMAEVMEKLENEEAEMS